MFYSLVKPSSSFKAFLNASHSKSFADVSSYPGPALWNLTELTHNSFMEPPFLKSLVVVVMSACVFTDMQSCVCIHVHVFVCLLMCRYMCVHVQVAVRRQLQLRFHKCYLLPLRQSLSLAWSSSASLEWLVRGPQRCSCAHLPSTEITSEPPGPVFYMVLGIWLRFLCL